ncbi:hypothetical protein CSUI_003642, partial [Cystoisospora suis]
QVLGVYAGVDRSATSSSLLTSSHLSHGLPTSHPTHLTNCPQCWSLCRVRCNTLTESRRRYFNLLLETFARSSVSSLL